MAKISKALSFKRAEIDIDEGTITEVMKDDINVYKLEDVLKEWNKISNISISFKQDDEFECTEENDDEGVDD